MAVLWATSGQPGAHDVWLESDFYRLKPNQLVEIRSGGGAIFGESHAPLPLNRISARLSLGPLGKTVRLGRVKTGEAWLVQEFAPTEPGNYWIAFSTGPTRVALEASLFNEYLRDHGLSDALSERRRQGAAERDASEESHRYGKIYLQVGAVSSPNVDQPIGQALEILLLDNPYAAGLGHAIRVKVLFRGRPLANLRIEAGRRGLPEATFSGITDGQGRLQVPIAHSGDWYVKGVHLIRSQDKEDHYESYWASVTFAVEGE